ncbi:MAG: D-alanine--D-alanine ligase family protein [Candidatus Binatia bacterium]
MSKLRICILSEANGEQPQATGRARPKRRKRAKEDREQIFDILKKADHDPYFHVLDGEPASLLSLAKIDADLVFNLTESYGGDDTKEMNVGAFLELLGLRFTGAGPQGLYLAQDKAIAKKLLAFHGIHTPYFATGYRGRLEWSHDIQFPLIVKPALEDGSIGIRFNAVVHSVKDLMQRIDEIHAEFDSPVLIEEYIEGREIYVGVLGNANAEALPIIELDLSQLPEGTPRVAGTEVKWEEGTEIYKATQLFFPEDLPADVVEQIQKTAVSAFQVLKLRDYGRIDVRLTPEGKIYVLEVNPNPWLLSSAEFARAARKAGRSHPQMIQDIVDLAMSR